MNNGPSWAAIIVAYLPGDELLAAVESVWRAGADTLIVWDNSPDEAAARLLRPSGLKATIHGDGTNYGFGVANNLAVDHLRDTHDYVFFVNPDCMIDEDVPARLLRALQENPDLAAVAPRMRYPDGTFGIAGGPFPSILKEVVSETGADELLPAAWRRAILEGWGPRRRDAKTGSYGASFASSGVNRVDWVSGFAMMARSDCFRAVGGFDPGYFLYFEDVDLCHRFRDAGYGVALVGSAQALHLESVSTAARGKSDVYRAGRRRYFASRGGTFARRIALLLWRG